MIIQVCSKYINEIAENNKKKLNTYPEQSGIAFLSSTLVMWSSLNKIHNETKITIYCT